MITPLLQVTSRSAKGTAIGMLLVAGSFVGLPAEADAQQAATYSFVDPSPGPCGSASLDTTDLPRLGTTFTVEVPPNQAPIDGPLSYVLTGFQLLPSPVDIGVVTGHQPCGPTAAFCGFLVFEPAVVQPVLFGVGGSATVSLTIPLDITLAGLTFYQQNATVGSGFGPRCVNLSRTGVGVLGI